MKSLPIWSMLGVFVCIVFTSFAQLAASRSDDINNLFSQDDPLESSIFNDVDSSYNTADQGIFESPNMFALDDFSTTDDPSLSSSSSELLTLSFPDLSTANLFDSSNPDLYSAADSSDLLIAGGILSPECPSDSRSSSRKIRLRTDESACSREGADSAPARYDALSSSIY